MDSTDAAVLSALRAGARGYLLKETAAESIGHTVAAMVRGELVIDARLAPRVVSLLAADRRHSLGVDGLTSREIEILGLVARGLGNNQIAAKLYLAEKTVRNNITALLAKTEQATRPALIAYARDRGIGAGPNDLT